MEHKKNAILQELGISLWQIRKPELFSVPVQPEQISLGDSELLLIAESQDRDKPLTQAILKAIGVAPEKVACLSFEQFEAYAGPLPVWVWSTQGEISPVVGHYFLFSPAVDEMVNAPLMKQQLWRQICVHLENRV